VTATLEAIEDELPNGLHDALLRGMSINYVEQRASFAIDVLVSTPEIAGPSKYRSLELTVDGMLLVVIDPPLSLATPADKSLRIDAGSGQPSTAPMQLPVLPAGYFLHWLFVSQWNSFIRVAGRAASYRWFDENK
jgi:hypothetical protein